MDTAVRVMDKLGQITADPLTGPEPHLEGIEGELGVQEMKEPSLTESE